MTRLRTISCERLCASDRLEWLNQTPIENEEADVLVIEYNFYAFFNYK